MPRSARPKTPQDVTALVDTARRVVEKDGAIPRSKLGPAAVRDQVVDALRALHFEVTPKTVRLPIEGQLEAVLRDGGYIAAKTAASHVRGATAAEVKTAVEALVQSGRARRVLRTATETLVPLTADVVAESELAVAAKRASELAKLLQAAVRKGKGWALLRDDVRRSMSAVLVDAPPRSQQRELALPPVLDRVLEAIDEARDAGVGLTFVPKVVGLLSTHLDAATVKKTLLDGASRGLLELRPEGGLGRLSDAELRACPEGPQGTRLSWARRIEVLS